MVAAIYLLIAKVKLVFLLLHLALSHFALPPCPPDEPGVNTHSVGCK